MPPLSIHTFKTTAKNEMAVGSATWHPVVDGRKMLVATLKEEVDRVPRSRFQSQRMTLPNAVVTTGMPAQEPVAKMSNCGPPLDNETLAASSAVASSAASSSTF